MKVRLTFFSEKPILIPIAYNYIVQSMIYNLVKNRFPDLHDKGFPYRKRQFKLFSFSRLFSKRFKIRDKMIEFQSPLFLFFSSPIKDLVEAMVNSMLKNQILRIGNNELFLTEISPIYENILNTTINVKTFSPITVYRTLFNGQTQFYSPQDPDFISLVKLNLFKKANILNIEPKDFYIEPLDSGKEKLTVTFYKNFMIKGWSGKFRLTGDKKMLDLALSTGLGAKNSQGFGLIVLEEVKMWDS
ncbi:CRISPR-associated endoribonuclease Cas6 [Mesoaciditoga lauensis]|uniref:CRISPR-associated endoribonuclease Cas6 n=1 Tax=Mesoaciditoga lauensis TaxID=1495039 RepID=UPI00055FF3F0|nr:CRISPR-associated endoribonuclease Cas6 [Mesoaciditoga lauensis]